MTEQLKAIFPAQSAEELREILSRHENDVAAAVEAILQEQSESCDDQTTTTTTREVTIQHSPDERQSPVQTAWWESPTICTPPPDRPQQNVSSEPSAGRHQNQVEDQELAELQEEEEAHVKAALEASMNPSDRGRLAGLGDLTAGQPISDETLRELMRNPVFVAQLDKDLKAAIELQQQLDSEERQEQSNGSDGWSDRPATSSSVRERLFSIVGASFLKRPSQDENVVQVEHNRFKEEHQKTIQELERVKKEAEAACMQAIKDHLAAFLQEHPMGTYEQWIEELHPENAESGELLEGLSKTIDFRFYVEDSDHRILWNDSIMDSGRRYVPAKHYYGTDTIDLLADTNGNQENVSLAPHRHEKHLFSASAAQNESSSSTPEGDGDLISFDH